MHHVKILCTGDLHLGRVSSKCTHEGEEAGEYSVRNTWRRVVDCAIDRQVSLVLLSGDIADDGGNQYEAMGPFEAGVARLFAQHIPVFLVAGNHDARTLPLIMRVLEPYHARLLGRNGDWEQCEWPEAAPVVSLIGWSHADRTVPKLPLETLQPQHRAGLPMIALAHTDYRTSTDNYAACSLDALRRVPGIDLWLLGHIHAAEKLDGPPIILNSGSPQALDPGEAGAHGPWLVEITHSEITNVEQIPLSSVLYCAISVDVSAMTEEDELVALLLAKLHDVRSRKAGGSYAPRISCRVTLTGRTRLLNHIYKDCDTALQEQPLLEAHDIYLEQITRSAVGPECNLAELVTQGGVIASLAAILLDLENGGQGEAAPFVRAAEELARREVTAPAFGIAEVQQEAPAAREVLTAECRRLLEELLRQREARA